MAKKLVKKRNEYQRYPEGMKQHAVRRMLAGESMSKLARELGVCRPTMYRWKWKAQGRPEVYAGDGPQDLREQEIRQLKSQVADLEASLGRQTQAVLFFKDALRGIAAQRQQRSESGAKEFSQKSASAAKRKAH